MAFGQAAGPPASARQVERLTDLLAESGFHSFREARHPFGLSQRQAGGRFTRTEAEELIQKLESRSWGDAPAGTSLDPATPHATGAQVPFSESAKRRVAERVRQAEDEVVVRIADEVLADELARRGWCCIPPE